MSAPPVWARKGVALHTCPVSYVTSESQALLEEFAVGRRLGVRDLAEFSARQVEAFVILEKAVTVEIHDEQRNRRAAQ